MTSNQNKNELWRAQSSKYTEIHTHKYSLSLLFILFIHLCFFKIRRSRWYVNYGSKWEQMSMWWDNFMISQICAECFWWHQTMHHSDFVFAFADSFFNIDWNGFKSDLYLDIWTEPRSNQGQTYAAFLSLCSFWWIL